MCTERTLFQYVLSLLRVLESQENTNHCRVLHIEELHQSVCVGIYDERMYQVQRVRESTQRNEDVPRQESIDQT